MSTRPSVQLPRAAVVSVGAFLHRSFCHTRRRPPSKPKIRAITAFVRLDRAHYKEQIQDTLNFLRQAKSAFEKSGYEVQTIRITTQPFPEYTQRAL